MNSNSSRLGSTVLAALLFLLIGIVIGGLFLPSLSLFSTTPLATAMPENAEAIQVNQNLETPTTVVEATVQQATEAIESVLEVDPVATAVEEAPAGDLALDAAQLTGFALEDTLVDLYAGVNPSVVFIFAYRDNFPLGSGSGFVYDAEGHIITNNHVIENGDRYELLFPGGDRTSAVVVGTDADADIAVIKASNLPENALPLPIGSSTELSVGQFVVAIGNPFGQQSSMSLGIVSAVGRSLPSDRQLETGGRYSLPDAIQIDAPINPGNSGGPLLNLNGEVVGINARIFSETGVNSGVGFSIPIDIVSRMIPSLIETGSYTYPFLGVSIHPPIDLRTQEAYGLPQTQGAYVSGVSENGPAAAAGIVPLNPEDFRGGDLIIAIDGEQVNTFEDLISYLYLKAEIGGTVTLTVLRGEAEVEVPVVVGERP
ncbi:MAG: trypsin-like peptidase domain-containing protein [Chloroflexota bacterium]